MPWKNGSPERLGVALAILAALGLLGYYGASILDFIGLRYISAGLERLILFTYPTLTVLIGVLFMGRSLSRRELGSLALSYAGIGLAFSHDIEFAGDSRAVPIYFYGAGMALFSTVLPVFWQSAAIRRIGSAKAVMIGTVGPVLVGVWLVSRR